MKELILDSYAKINLALEILGKRDDGYHNIHTVFQEIDIRDGLYLRQELGGSLELSCDYKLLPLGKENIVYVVWELMKDMYDGDPGVRAHIEKNIPIAAGLAGGSSNAASMIKGLNELWDLNLETEELMAIGAKVGADVPFFFMRGTALGVGKGDDLSRISSFAGQKILIVNTGYGVSTKYVYEKYKEIPDYYVDFNNIIKTLNNKDYESLYPLLKNELESVTIALQPDVGEIKSDMMRLGARASLMCGSGPTVFGIFDNDSKLENAFFFFKDKFDLVFSTETR